MTMPRTLFEQREERMSLVIKKIRHDIFKLDKDNLYSRDEICKKLPMFTKPEIFAAIRRLDEQGLLICDSDGAEIYYGEKYP